MDNDTLRDFLKLAARELPDVPGDVWPRLARLAEKHYARCFLYVHANKKAISLQEIAAAPDATSAELAARLGCTPRNIQHLRKLLREGS